MLVMPPAVYKFPELAFVVIAIIAWFRFNDVVVNTPLIISISASLLLYVIHDYDDFYVKYVAVIMACALFASVLKESDFLKSFVKIYLVTVLLIGLSGFVAYVLFISGFSPISFMKLPDGRTLPLFVTGFVNFGFSQDWSLANARYSGLWDEPGRMAGTLILGIVLSISTGLGLRIRYVLYILGFMTFSIAFYLIASLLAIYEFFVLKEHSSASLVFVLVLLVVLLQLPFFDDTILSLINRFSVVESDGFLTIAGDNRQVENLRAIQAFNDNMLVGVGFSKTTKEYGHVNATILGILGSHGLIGLLMYLYPLRSIFIGFIERKKWFLGLIVLLFLYQQPYFHFLVFMLPLYTVSYYFRSSGQ